MKETSKTQHRKVDEGGKKKPAFERNLCESLAHMNKREEMGG